MKIKLKKFWKNSYKSIWLASNNKLKYKFKIINNIYMEFNKK